MSMTDPIADLLTRIRNAHRAKHDRLDVPASKVKLEVCRILKQEGYIKNVSVVEDKPSDQLRIVLSYTKEGSPGITRMRSTSPAPATTCGWSNRIPCMSGYASSSPDSRAPRPPPTSTIVRKRAKSYVSTTAAFMRRDRSAIAWSKAALSSVCSLR